MTATEEQREEDVDLSAHVPHERDDDEPMDSVPAERTAADDPIPPEISRTMRTSIIEGCATMVFLTWTTGAVLAGYLIYLGATPMQIGLGASLPMLAQAVAPLAAWVQGIIPRRRLLVAGLSVFARGLWVVPGIIPFLGLEPETSIILILCVVAVASSFASAAGAIWSAWMGEIVPPARRGRYFGLRGGIHAVVGMIAGLAAGRMLDLVPAPLNFQLLLLIGICFASLGIYLYTRHYEPPEPLVRFPLREIFSAPVRDANFRRFLMFALYWQMAVFVAAPFVYPYFISHLRLSFTQIAIWQAIAAGLILFTGPWWGKIADKYGNKPVLTIATIIAGSVLPLTWMMARPGDPSLIYFNAVMDAACWGAITPAIFNLALATAAPHARIAYLSMFSLATGIAGFIGGLLGGFLMGWLEPFQFTLFGFEWTNYHSIFLIAMVLRLQAFRLLRPLEETNSWRTRDVWRMFMRWRLAGFFWR